MSWYSYSSGQELRNELDAKLEQRRKRGESFVPVQVQGKGSHIAQTFWGRAWCRHLEAYHDYQSRLPRGRSYLRQGNVYNLLIEPGLVSAQVAGSSLYEVQVHIQPLPQPDWVTIRKACAGQVGSLLDLLAGRLGAGVLELISDPARGLFPAPKQIRMSCTCPDWADMCKHVAATLYGVGVVFDSDPALFFRLRGVDPAELLAEGAREAIATVHSAAPELAPEDLGALFGIDLATDLPPEPEPLKKAAPRAKKAASGKAPKPAVGKSKTRKDTPPRKAAKAPVPVKRRGSAGGKATEKAASRRTRRKAGRG